MTQDRIANWGESESAARYQTGDDDPDGGDFIVARDLDGQRMLLKFDFAANEWQYAGDVDMGGGDLNSVGTARVDALKAESVSTDKGNITATEAPFNSGFVEDFRSESFAHYDIRKQDANFDFVESPRINDDSPTLRHNPDSASGDSLLSSVVYGGAGFRYSLVGRFDSTSGPEIDIFTIVADDDNFLRFKFEARNNTAEITENVAGTNTTLASESSLTVNPDEWYTLLSDVGASYAKFDILDEGGTSILSDKLTASITENQGTGFGFRCRSDGNDNTFITHLARRGL